MMENRDFVRFLWWTAGVVFAGALLEVAFVVVADPYRIYRLVDRAGFNNVKPAPTRYQEEIKLTGAHAIGVNAFIMGNSRAEIGFDPEHPGFGAGGLSAYNLAISGTRVSTARRQAAYLRSKGIKPDVIVLGVEFLDFLQYPVAQSGYVRPANAADALRWKFDTLFSLASVSDALDTLQIQHRDEVETMTTRGFNPLLEYKKYARDQGYYALFQQRAQENAKSFARKSRTLMKPQDSNAPDVRELRAILSENAGQGTTVHVVIYPYHAQMLALFEKMGLWPLFDEWKKFLAGEVDVARKAHPAARITLWDFSGFSEFQCEYIPGKGDTKTPTKWYWEAGHFKPALGNLILDRLLAKPDAPVSGGGLGFPLTVANLDENTQRIEKERAACAAAYPSLFADVATLAKAARPTD